MKPSRVFRTIWRLNGVLILLTFVLLGGLALVAAISSAPFRGERTRAAPAAVVAATGEKLFFGSIEDVEGSPYVIIPLEARRPGTKFSSGPSRDDQTRNLLFYDAAGGGAHWLRPDHGTVIVRHELLRASGAGERRWDRRAAEDDPVRWIRYELATADTDGDGEIDARDARQLAVSGPDGRDLAVVVEGIGEVLGYVSPRPGRLLVFFRRGDAEFAAEIDLATRKVARTVPLPRS